MDDFIRAFMGIPRRGEPPSFFDSEGNNPNNNFQDPDVDRFFFAPPPPRFFFRGSFGSPFGGQHSMGHVEDHPFGEGHPSQREGMHSDDFDMFKHFDDMFRSFDEAFRHVGVASHPSIEYHQRPKKPDSLREEMLKNPDSNPHAERPRRFVIVPPMNDQPHPMVRDPSDIPASEKIDRDIDNEVKDADLDAILDGMNSPLHQEVHPLKPQIKSQFKSVSIRTYRGPDGKFHQEKTVKDSEGNVEQVVTKRVGEQEHSVISKSDKTGVKEKIENFVNMDESDKPVFQKLWEDPSKAPPVGRIEEPAEPIDQDSRSMFNKLFGSDLPFFRK